MTESFPQVITKDFPTANLCEDLSIATNNAKYTRFIWRTHQDFHNHKFWEICIVLKGKGKHHFLTHVDDMYAGTMWLLRPNDVHMIEPLEPIAPSTDSYAHRDIYIEDSTIKRILNAFNDGLYDTMLHAEKPFFSRLPLQEVINLESMINYYSMNDSHFEFMHSVLTSHVLACAIEQNSYILKKDKPEWLNTLLINLNKFDFMTLPMREIISSIGYSQEHICREFKKHMGSTLGKYLQRMKCMYSLSLLTDTNIPIIDIANKLCFPDESNYITTFRKLYNITPGEWRKHFKHRDSSNKQ